MRLSIRTLSFLQPLAPAVILFGTLFINGAHADVAQTPALPAPPTNAVLISQAVANLSVPDFRVSRQDEQSMAPQVSSPSSDLEDAVSAPPAPQSIGPGSLLLPILIIVLAGSIRRYYTSPAYKNRQLYESIYGPLSWH